MIAFLEGRVESWQSDGAVLNVRGVGYEFAPLPGWSVSPGRQIKVHIHFHQKDQGPSLYGFESQGQREAFRSLLKVRGLGPRKALALMGHLGLEGLEQALSSSDVKALAKSPGMGQKGAQRLLAELKGVWQTPPPARSAPQDPLAAALEGLGFQPDEVAPFLEENPKEELEERIRQALRRLGGRS